MNNWQIAAAVAPWLLSAVTLYSQWLAGNLSRKAWLWALVAQSLWCLYTAVVWNAWGWLAAVGMLPLNVGGFVVYYRNHRNWKQL